MIYVKDGIGAQQLHLVVRPSPLTRMPIQGCSTCWGSAVMVDKPKEMYYCFRCVMSKKLHQALLSLLIQWLGETVQSSVLCKHSKCLTYSGNEETGLCPLHDAMREPNWLPDMRKTLEGLSETAGILMVAPKDALKAFHAYALSINPQFLSSET